MSDLQVHRTKKDNGTDAVVMEYKGHGHAMVTNRPYNNSYVSIVRRPTVPREIEALGTAAQTDPRHKKIMEAANNSGADSGHPSAGEAAFGTAPPDPDE